MSTALVPEGLAAYRTGVDTARRTAFEPSPPLTVWEAADRYRVLSADAGAVEPGRWQTNRAPYLRGIMDALTDPTRRRVVLLKSSQIGGSEVALNWAHYLIGIAPAPFLVVFPSDEMLKNWSAVRLDAMIRDSPRLTGRVYDDTGGRRDKRSTLRRKTYRGGFYIGVTARSSTSLKSWAAPFGIAEEIDEYGDHPKQGDPIDRLERAIRVFLRFGGKLFLNSTPSLEGYSRIWDEYEASDQQLYLVPCPQCNAAQELRWRDEDGTYRFEYERDRHGRLVWGSTHYRCEACGARIPHTAKEAMVAAGQWSARAPHVTDVAGFAVWSAYSPFVSWDQICEKWIESAPSPEKRKVFWNTWLGLTYREEAERLSAEGLKVRVESYGQLDADTPIEVPHGVGVLTAAIDVQSDRLELMVCGYGAGEESWIIAWDQVQDIDPAKPEPFDVALERLWRPWQHASGQTLRPAQILIDAGYMTPTVVAAAQRARRKGLPVLAVVGREGRGKELIEAPPPTKWRKSRAKTHPMHVVRVDSVKDLLYLSRFRVRDPGPGYVHIPETMPPAFFDQVTAEELRAVKTGNVKVGWKVVRRWVLKPDRANEAGDLCGYCLAGLHNLGSQVLAQLGALAERASRAVDRAPGAATGATAAPVSGRRVVSEGIDW